jgi:tetratricopeptide (TPR) repeat protein
VFINSVDRNYTIALNNLGLLHYDCDNHQEAIANYTDALAINPDYAIAYFNRALVHDKLENLEDVNKSFFSVFLFQGRN